MANEKDIQDKTETKTTRPHYELAHLDDIWVVPGDDVKIVIKVNGVEAGKSKRTVGPLLGGDATAKVQVKAFYCEEEGRGPVVTP